MASNIIRRMADGSFGYDRSQFSLWLCKFISAHGIGGIWVQELVKIVLCFPHVVFFMEASVELKGLESPETEIRCRF